MFAIDYAILGGYHTRIRPFGIWPREWKSPHGAEHRRDIVRLVVALLWQVMTFLLPMLLVLRMWPYLVGVFIPWLVLTILLWRDALGAPGDEAEPPSAASIEPDAVAASAPAR